jgi:hypothetical protein
MKLNKEHIRIKTCQKKSDWLKILYVSLSVKFPLILGLIVTGDTQDDHGKQHVEQLHIYSMKKLSASKIYKKSKDF